ncbi:unnamed protein product, partial [Mesorhabditis spiculigera]
MLGNMPTFERCRAYYGTDSTRDHPPASAAWSATIFSSFTFAVSDATLLVKTSSTMAGMGQPRHSVYVGNLPYQTTENDLGNFFSQAGQVTNVRIVYDRETGRAKGFGFCEFADEGGAQNAINMFNGADFNGRALRVNAANR